MVVVPCRASSISVRRERNAPVRKAAFGVRRARTKRRRARLSRDLKPRGLKPRPGRAVERRRARPIAFAPRIADRDRVFDRGLRPTRGGFPINRRDSLVDSDESRRPLRAESAPIARSRGSQGNLASQSLVFFGFAKRTSIQRSKDRRFLSPASRLEKLPNAAIAGVKRLSRSVTAEWFFADSVVGFSLSELVAPAGALDAHSHARAARRTPKISCTRPRTSLLDAPSTPTAFAARAHAATPPEARPLHLRIESNVSRARVKHRPGPASR